MSRSWMMKSWLIMLAIFFVSSFCFAQGKPNEVNSPGKDKFDLAINYFSQNDFDKARKAFNESLNIEPAPYNAIVYYNIASCYQIQAMAEKEKGNLVLADEFFVKALEQYQKAQAITPYFPQIYSNTALIYFNQNKPKATLDEVATFGQQLTDELGAFPPDVGNRVYSYRSYEALLSVAVNYIGSSNFEEAAKVLRNVVSQMDQNPPKKKYIHYTAYNSLGLSLFRLGDMDGAINSFESSIKVDPAQPRLDTSYANLGMLYFNKGDYLKADEAVAHALSINAQNETALDYQKKLKDVSGDKVK